MSNTKGFFSLKKILIAAGVLILLLVIYNLINGIFGAFKSGDRLNQALEQLNKLEAENKQLKQQYTQVQTNSFIEQQARDKLLYAKPGETVVVIPESKLDAVLGISAKKDEVRLPNPLGWLKLFWR